MRKSLKPVRGVVSEFVRFFWSFNINRQYLSRFDPALEIVIITYYVSSFISLVKSIIHSLGSFSAQVFYCVFYDDTWFG